MADRASAKGGGSALVCLVAILAASSPAMSEDAAPQEAADSAALHWRDDPDTRRRPGSYLGGGVGYANLRAWVPEGVDHDDFRVGPLHTWMITFRVGDAFSEWFALGFQIGLTNHTRGEEQAGLFNLMLDLSFHPWAGLGIRPSVGLGLGFAGSEREWEFGGGGPAAAALAVLYEIRVARLFVISPAAQVVYVGGNDFDGLAVFLGIEVIKWFATATG